jgi:hypothetical protein
MTSSFKLNYFLSFYFYVSIAFGNFYRWKHVNVQNEIREMFHFTDTFTRLIQSWRKHDFNRDISILALTELTGIGGHAWLLRCVTEFVVLFPESLPCFAAAFLVYSVLVPHPTPPASRTPQRGINSGLISRFESGDVHCWGILLSDIKEWLTSTTQTMQGGTYLLFAEHKFAGSIPMYATRSISCRANNSGTFDVRIENFHECQTKVYP